MEVSLGCNRCVALVDNFKEVVENNVTMDIVIAVFETFQRSFQTTINMGQA
jgi:hypothetical protein